MIVLIYPGLFNFPAIIKPLIMKKIQLLAMGSMLFLIFASCKKENMETVNSKKAAVNQGQSAPAQSAGQPENPPQTQPPSGCPHATASAAEG